MGTDDATDQHDRNGPAADDPRQAYLDELVRARGYVLPYHKVLVAQDVEVLRAFNDLLQATYFAPRTLDRKTKELLFCATLTVARAPRGHIQSHVRAALDAGATPREVLEALELTLPEAGVVAFQEGFEAWAAVVGAQGIEPSIAAYDAQATGERED